MTFDHEKLDVYQRSLDMLDLIDEIVEQLPSGRAHLKDQIDRAATSVVLNIAEGTGEFSTADKHRFYRMARRSATETAAVLDIFARRNLAGPLKLTAARDLLLRIVAMLVRMTSPRPGSGAGTGTGAGTEQPF